MPRGVGVRVPSAAPKAGDLLSDERVACFVSFQRAICLIVGHTLPLPAKELRTKGCFADLLGKLR